MAELKNIIPTDEDDILLDMENRNGDSGAGKSPLGLHFNSGGYKIDYVLVYERSPEEEETDDEKAKLAEEYEEKRDAFEKVLLEEGLLIEREMIVSTQNEKIQRHFVKLHIPWKTFSEKAEEIKLKAPLMKSDIREFKTVGEQIFGERIMNKLGKLNPFTIKDSVITERPTYFMAYYKQRKHDKYLGHERNEKMFSTLDRHYAIQRICYTARFAEGPKGVGLKQLLYEGAYTSGYPLHDGDDDVPEGRLPDNDRQRLKRDWSRFGRMFKYQPLDVVKDYFGTAIALYFAWLGFYTAMLVPLAIVGLLVFIYGIGSASTDPAVNDSCNLGLFMCNLCDKQCSYWLLNSTCLYARATHFFDNDGTVFLAIFTSLWATLFLEFWKRRQAVLADHWHVANFEEEEEQIRPEFAATAPTLKKNPITGMLEPHIPKRTLYQRYGAIGSIIAFMIFLVIAAVVGVVVYRGAVFAALSANKTGLIRKNSRIITTCTAALINLLCINILKFLYIRLAVWLTNWENPRTKTDYEDSFTYKMYIFQFVNTYASIFYIAFFKSDYAVGSPGKYHRIGGSGIRFDGCSEQGCFLELCIQLIIIMVGQQIIGNISEVVLPALKTWWKERKEPKNKTLPQYEQDFNLGALEDHYMFWEYLEIVLQYGFVTMFVAAFPLAPIFSLLNSIAEIRVDALNFVTQFRRPDTVIAEDIGAWTRIMEILTRISVLVNAFILAFTSEFIPKLVYKTKIGHGTLHGYLNNSLSSIGLSYLKGPPEYPNQNVNASSHTTCRYKGYYDSTYPFATSTMYWNVVAARLAFVFVFQYTVYGITTAIARAIPDKPASLDLRIRREDHLTKKILYPKREKAGRDGKDRDRVDSGHSGML